MSDSTPSLLRKISFFPLVAAGVLIFVWLQGSRAEPTRTGVHEQGRRVRVMTVTPLTVVPRAQGYGVVEARRQWELVSQVSGRVVEMSDKLAVGAIVPAGTVLLKIDPEDYQLAEQQQKASVAAVQAQIKELDTKLRSAKRSLQIEKRSLELAEQNLARLQALVKSGSVSQADADAEERNVLAQREVVQNLNNTIDEIPASKAVYRTQIQQYEAGLAGAKLDVARTEIVAPFDVRVREVNTELREVVGASQVLAVADGIETAEVPAQFPIGSLRPLLPFRPRQTPLSTDMLSRLPELSGISAVIRLESDEITANWDAKFERFTAIDPTTRTVGVVVSVPEPLRNSEPGVRPPLISGMYVEVELRGQPREGCMAVPRAALHGDEIYVMNPERRLAKHKVEVAFRQSDYVCIKTGVTQDDTVLLTDLVPAIEGMLLDPETDASAMAALVQASGSVQIGGREDSL